MAEDARSSVGALLALVAHDLRNPLSALHSNVGFLESALSPKEQDAVDALSDIVASCSSLKHIIDNLELLGLSVLDEPPRFERFPSSLWELAADAVQRLEPIATSYGASVTLEGERFSAPRVVVQRDMFVRALGNLLFNAIQSGGSQGQVVVVVSGAGGKGVVSVSDSGPVLSATLRSSAFTATGQLDCKGDPRGRYSRGLGLFAAATAAAFCGAEVRGVDGPSGRNAFELTAPLA
ncbi:MAG: HAMP domain-containing sensor histidine kinase [Polyangiaceae bacterium]